MYKQMKSSVFCNCLFFSSQAFAREMNKLAESHFLKTGWSSSYAFTMMLVNKHSGITPTEIATELHLSPSTVTRLLDKLELKGMITRVEEGKKITVFHTPKSQLMFESLEKAWVEIFNEYNSILGESASKELAAILYTFTGKLKTLES